METLKKTTPVLAVNRDIIRTLEHYNAQDRHDTYTSTSLCVKMFMESSSCNSIRHTNMDIVHHKRVTPCPRTQCSHCPITRCQLSPHHSDNKSQRPCHSWRITAKAISNREAICYWNGHNLCVHQLLRLYL